VIGFLSSHKHAPMTYDASFSVPSSPQR
jgi:hypothetical protein